MCVHACVHVCEGACEGVWWSCVREVMRVCVRAYMCVIRG